VRYIDEYRDRSIVEGLVSIINHKAGKLNGDISIMEVCGTHTNAIGRFGIRGMLPSNIRLISGPGCPVCVTSINDIDIALYLARQNGVIFTTFGDMLRVPGTGGISLQQLRAEGADVRIVTSPMDCIAISLANPAKKVVFMGIGFETTSPTVAALILRAEKQGVQNLSVLSVHKLIPPAMKALMDDPELNIDGFICPGHVSTIIGARAYDFIAESSRAAVVTGFEPVDILEGILMIVDQVLNSGYKVEIQYARAVKDKGNLKAKEMLSKVFAPADAEWRGLGMMKSSGLVIRHDYGMFDAARVFDIPDISSEEFEGCICGDILRGYSTPKECPLFKKVCTPQSPVGPCMVSSEGTCAAYYRYY